jgi:hypothetical protein
MGFQKGKPKTGGRLPGQPNKITLDIKGYARAVVEDPSYQAKLKQRLLNGSAPQLEILLHYYAYGKPKQELVSDKTVNVIVYGPPAQAVLDVQPAITDRSTHDDAATVDHS